jgi:hypothetical protein
MASDSGIPTCEPLPWRVLVVERHDLEAHARPGQLLAVGVLGDVLEVLELVLSDGREWARQRVHEGDLHHLRRGAALALRLCDAGHRKAADEHQQPFEKDAMHACLLSVFDLAIANRAFAWPARIPADPGTHNASEPGPGPSPGTTLRLHRAASSASGRG